MTPFKHPLTTKSLAKPPNWDEEKQGKCNPLWVLEDQGGFFSYWKPSWQDLWRLVTGGHVRLHVCGGAHPPVCLDTED